MGRQIGRNNSNPGFIHYITFILAVLSVYMLSCLDLESFKLSRFLGASDTDEVHHVYSFNETYSRGGRAKANSISSQFLFAQNASAINVNDKLLHSISNATRTQPDILPKKDSSQTNRRNIGYERLGPKANYLPLSPPNSSHPVSVGACCGIGHRLCFNIPTFIYAIQNSRPISSVWPDIPWSKLFNDTIHIKAAKKWETEHYNNNYPKDWLDYTPKYAKGVMAKSGTSYDDYKNQFVHLFDMPVAQSVAHSLQNSLSPSVLSFLTNIREQSYQSELHLCAHIRQGNNETGDWQRKSWRHIDLNETLTATLFSMGMLAKERKANNVTVFVASDNPHSRTWFQSHVPPGWKVILPQKEMTKPKSGVWFGESNSKTNSVLNQEQKSDIMAEAVSDIFALGECDALFIPNYSSFSLISIMLMRAERKAVSFMHKQTLEYVGFPYPETVTANTRTITTSPKQQDPIETNTSNNTASRPVSNPNSTADAKNVTVEGKITSEAIQVCNNITCKQPDPPGGIRLLEFHRGLALMLHDWKDCKITLQCNLAYLMIPKAGSTLSKNTLMATAGRKEKVWLSFEDGTNSTNYNPYIFTVIRHPGERIASAYSTIISRYGGAYLTFGRQHHMTAKTPQNTTDVTSWSKHFSESIRKMINHVNTIGWSNTQAAWNVHIVPQVEFMRNLNVSHIGCVNSINVTFTKMQLNTKKEMKNNVYEHNLNMPEEKFASFDLIDDETKALIQKLYADDYKLYHSTCG